MDYYNQLRRQAMENSTLLWALKEVPEKPSKNKALSIEGTWILPFYRECQLADDLAFIASYEYNANEVMAVCIEETAEDSVLIRIASNVSYPFQAARNLQHVADLMIQAIPLNVSRYDPREALFARIVSMDKVKIISRLRSKRAARSRKTGQPSLPSLLKRTTDKCSTPNGESFEGTRIAQVKSQCQEMWNTFEMFEGMESTIDSADRLEVLRELVTQAYNFDIDALEAVLSNAKDLDPSTREYLPEALRKLGRYYKIARTLPDAVRDPKNTIFKNIIVTPIECNNLDVGTLKKGVGEYSKVLSRVQGSRKKKKLPTTNLPVAVRQKYQSHMFQSPGSMKVHAEVQLLLFYQLHPTSRPPRVMCSNKSACYLCNLFFEIHGQFHIPRTHGRIYDQWTLPSWSSKELHILAAITPLLERFNQTLSNKILQVLRSKEVKATVCPNESVAALYTPWSSNATIVPSLPPSIHLHETQSAGVSHSARDNVAQNSSAIPKNNLKPHAGSTSSNTSQSTHKVQGSSSREQHTSASTIASLRRPRERVVQPGDEFRIRTDAIDFNISVIPKVANSEHERRNAFLITLEPTTPEPNELGDAAQTPVIDIDKLLPDSDTVLPVGAALPCNRLIVKGKDHAVAISFRFVH